MFATRRLLSSASAHAVLPLVAACAFSACGGPEEEPRVQVPDGAVAGDFSSQPCTYEIKAGAFAADCGTLVVRENRSDPDSRLIALPVTRIRATGPEPTEPIFFLEGGPGISNMHFTRVMGLIDNHDIVMVGYRGLDGSVFLDCPEIDAVFGDPPGDLQDPGAMDTIADSYRRCGERLQSEGVDLDGYTVLDVVDDVEVARQALGYERIDLLSESYGTRLALYYAWIYPDVTHRSAMIGVNPPGHFVWAAEMTDMQLDMYAALCAKDPGCSARTDDLAESIRTVAHDLPERWLFFPIKRGNVLAGTFMMLYHTGTAAQVFDAWLAAEDGDASGLAMMSLAIDRMLPKATVWGEGAAKALSSDYDYDPETDYVVELNPPGSIIGAPGSLLGFVAAGAWPTKKIPAEFMQVQPSDVEMLLIGGNLDFSTPAEFATEELLPHLPNGQQVILSEFGHTADVWFKQPEATARLLSSFFDTGSADESLYEYAPMDFKVGIGFPEMIKLGLAAVVIVPLLLIGLIWFIVRRVRRRRRRKAEAAAAA